SDAYQVLIRHRLLLKGIAVRVGDQSRSEAGLASGRRLPTSDCNCDWIFEPGEEVRPCGCDSNSGCGARQEMSAIHGNAPCGHTTSILRVRDHRTYAPPGNTYWIGQISCFFNTRSAQLSTLPVLPGR